MPSPDPVHDSPAGGAVRRLEAAARDARARSAPNPSLTEPWTELAHEVAGPLLTIFVDWVLRDARQRGLERLYFVSRDGQVLLRIADALAAGEPSPSCHYLFGSRQAWLLPELVLSPQSWREWLLLPGHSTAPIHVLRRLDLDPREVAAPLASLGLPESAWSREIPGRDLGLYDRLLADAEVAAKLREKAELASRLTLGYLRQEGLLSGSRWALVDVGWTLKTQRALRRLLGAAGHPAPSFGYYLALLRRRLPATESGPALAFIDENEGWSALFRNVPLIEQVFTMADHGTVKGYSERDGRIFPRLESSSPDAARQSLATELQREILEFAAAYSAAGLPREELAPLRARALENAERFLARPPIRMARALATIEISDDQNEARRVPLARPLSFADLVAMSLRRLRMLDASRYARGFSWLEGSLALSSWPVRALAPLVRAAEAATARVRARSAPRAVG